MFNLAILIGRPTKEIKMRSTTDSKVFAVFTLAVQRDYKDHSGERPCDYITCMAWERKANLFQDVRKGDLIQVTGQWRTRKVDDRGEPRTVNELIVEKVCYLTKKASDSTGAEDPFSDAVKVTNSSIAQPHVQTLPFESAVSRQFVETESVPSAPEKVAKVATTSYYDDGSDDFDFE